MARLSTSCTDAETGGTASFAVGHVSFMSAMDTDRKVEVSLYNGNDFNDATCYPVTSHRLLEPGLYAFRHDILQSLRQRGALLPLGLPGLIDRALADFCRLTKHGSGKPFFVARFMTAKERGQNGTRKDEVGVGVRLDELSLSLCARQVLQSHDTR
jgi:hypothetical protein